MHQKSSNISSIHIKAKSCSVILYIAYSKRFNKFYIYLSSMHMYTLLKEQLFFIL